MANNEEKEIILLKFAWSFNRLLRENKSLKSENKTAGRKDIKLVSSLGGLSSETGLRKATLSAIFSGISNPEALTVVVILKALNKSFSQFSTYFDNITPKDLEKFRFEILENQVKYKKKKRGRKKSK
jgi:DNA-binding phage protein